ncbi:MAG: hypothetical protein FAF03_04965 [Epsilonproteobacteria bacterium]|nr:hypothetical protein [Campylobacterota bacterium]
MIYEIFGRNIQINIENIQLKNILKEELQHYLINNKNADVIITIGEHFPKEQEFSNTPTIHKSFKNAFLSDYGSYKILYINDVQLNIYVSMENINNFLRKFISIDFRENYDRIGHIVHELVLVPLNLFFNDRALIHASTMKNLYNGRTVMFGGTGGVGKTSLELLLCRELNYSFISDDIAIVTKDSGVYPNLAYPKIYAYNVENNKSLEKILFSNKPYIDKLQWNFIKKYRGNNRVRRSISPSKIYNSIEVNKNYVDEYYVLFKTNTVTSIEIFPITEEEATSVSFKIIQNEYQSVFQHIIWHEYNCELMNFSPLITMKNINQVTVDIYENFFKKVKCYKIKIPIDIKHDEFLNQMKDKFK